MKAEWRMAVEQVTSQLHVQRPNHHAKMTYNIIMHNGTTMSLNLFQVIGTTILQLAMQLVY